MALTGDKVNWSTSTKKPNPSGGAWWNEEPEKASQMITSNLEYWASNQRWRIKSYEKWARLYGNLPSTSLFGMNNARLGTLRGNMGERLNYNLVQSCIDTSISTLAAKPNPKPVYLTDDGDFKSQRRAKTLNKLITGSFYENDTFKKGLSCQRQSEIWGDGFLAVFPRNGKPCHEIVPAYEIWVDEVASAMTEPVELHRVKTVDRSILHDMFPDKTKIIDDASDLDLYNTGRAQTLSDLVTVRQSWKRPSSPGAGDGRTIITVSSGALTEMDEFTWDVFPFGHLRFCENPYGAFFAQGLAEQLSGLQAELSKLLWTVQRSLHLSGTFKIWAKTGSGIAIDHLNNEIGAVLRSEDRPEWILPQVVQPEFYQQIKQIKSDAYEQSGIPALAATSQKPAGLNSGVALREYADIGAVRHATVTKAYQDFYLQIAKLTILCAKEILETDKDASIKVRYPGLRAVESVDWSDIEWDEDDPYVIQSFSISSLPSDPAGRLQTIQEYMEAGLLTPDEGRNLLDFPDLQRMESLHNSNRDFLSETLDNMVDKGIYYTPEPFDDLEMAQKMALEYLQRGKKQKVPDKKLALLRQFIGECVKLQAMAKPTQSAPAGQPLAPPSARPPSELIQNTAQ